MVPFLALSLDTNTVAHAVEMHFNLILEIARVHNLENENKTKVMKVVVQAPAIDILSRLIFYFLLLLGSIYRFLSKPFTKLWRLAPLANRIGVSELICLFEVVRKWQCDGGTACSLSRCLGCIYRSSFAVMCTLLRKGEEWLDMIFHLLQSLVH